MSLGIFTEKIPMKNILYLGWLGYGNLGDELMYDLFKEQVQRFDCRVRTDMANIESRYLRNVSPQAFDLIVLGGGSILGGYRNYVHPAVIDFLHQCLEHKKKIMIWGTGIDWLPKSAIARLNNNERMHFPVAKDLQEKMERVFQESGWSGVRGPLTLKVLEQYGVTGHAFVSGDPAFLLNVRTDAGQEAASPLAEKLIGKKTIGVNWGTSFNHIYGRNEAELEKELADALNQLLENGYQIYLYAVWKPDFVPLQRLYHRLKRKDMVLFDNVLRDRHGVMNMLQHCTFTINLKLHANYLSLGAGVPFLALGYRFKVFDFFKSLELDDFIIATDEEDISSKLIDMGGRLTREGSAFLSSIQTKKEQYSEKLTEPFQHGLYL